MLAARDRRKKILRAVLNVSYNGGCFRQQREKTQKPTTKIAPHERFLEAFRWMLLTRVFRGEAASLYRGGMITGGVYIGRGQEAVSVACGMFLQKGDVFAPLIRDQAGRSAFGEPLARCGPHISWFATRTDARPRRKYSSR